MPPETLREFEHEATAPCHLSRHGAVHRLQDWLRFGAPLLCRCSGGVARPLRIHVPCYTTLFLDDGLSYSRGRGYYDEGVGADDLLLTGDPCRKGVVRPCDSRTEFRLRVQPPTVGDPTPSQSARVDEPERGRCEGESAGNRARHAV